ncbi:hypothetical protein DPMN_004364 [Dreissena polymorpha]|uniref:Uncharacterized protein n=1 Tax=Dreissena polymorpha TaxID=45954 RepID=A0A9D4MQP2_DREPO|nr:hypothetical protein DPMN_004364 [Dreissena polymorpha]
MDCQKRSQLSSGSEAMPLILAVPVPADHRLGNRDRGGLEAKQNPVDTLEKI